MEIKDPAPLGWRICHNLEIKSCYFVHFTLFFKRALLLRCIVVQMYTRSQYYATLWPIYFQTLTFEWKNPPHNQRSGHWTSKNQIENFWCVAGIWTRNRPRIREDFWPIELLRKPNRPKANNRQDYHRRRNKDNGILEIKKPTGTGQETVGCIKNFTF